MVRILYIEDDKEDCETVRGLLWMKFPNIHLTIAQTGQTGLKYLKERIQHREDLPSMIMLDLKLSDLNGKLVFELIRKMSKLERTPIAILTASDKPSDKDFFFLKPHVNYYEKPTKINEYKMILDDILDKC